jgi:creatinine amidohydrolase/Fe(II)-dependent formamide hydrolase-like protein
MRFSAAALLPLLISLGQPTSAAGRALAPLPQAAVTSVYIEELTWPEVRDAVAAGMTTVIVPTGGTEQNGPHMVLGKHNFLVHYKAGEIARLLGDALVAPVVTYVPEGNIDPPSGHMRFPGTISIPEAVFQQVLEHTARSLRQAGFIDIAFVGDSGGNQTGQAAVAQALNAEWADTGVRVHHVSDYYPGRGDDYAISQGVSPEDVGSHAGTHDTASLLFLDPSKLRVDQFHPGTSGDGQGHVGDPNKATAILGKRILEMQVEDGARQIRELREGSRP